MTDTALDRAKLLQRRLRGTGGRREAIPRADRDSAVPCSFGQQRLWFLNTLAPDSPEYNVSVVLRLTGALDREALANAVTATVRRHEILRTRYDFVGFEPVQLIDDEPERLGGWADSVVGQDSSAVDRLVRDILQTPFDLGLEQPWRCRLWETGHDEHLLVLVIHHIACDAQSVQILVHDLFASYSRHRAGAGEDLPALPTQYADFAVWRRQHVTGSRLRAALDHWRTELSGSVPLDLPIDRPRPATWDWSGGRVEVRVTPETTARLQQLARDHDTTLFTVALSAFQVLLGHYSGSRDVVVGTAVTGRNHPSVAELAGFFLNTAVLRSRWSGDPTFEEFVDDNKSTVSASLEHSEVPLQSIVTEVDGDRDLSRGPLFQVMFDMGEAVTQEHIAVDGIRIEPVGRGADIAKHDLRLELRPSADGGLEGEIEYACAIFDRETVDQLSTHLGEVLDAVAATPALPLSALQVADAVDDRTAAPPVAPFAASDLAGLAPHLAVRRRAQVEPDAVAASGSDFALTYAELDDLADRIAGTLLRSDAADDRPVAIFLGRGRLLLPAMLGTWRAGRAFVPVDPADPQSRAGTLIDVADASLILTDAHGAASLGHTASTSGRTVVDVGADLPEGAVPEVSPEESADRTAYVIFTSGSTGTPKGVVVSHRALWAYLAWARREYAPGGRATAPLFSSVAYDLVITTLFVPLLGGGEVVMVRQGIAPHELAAAIRGARPAGYTFIKMTPSHLELLTGQLSAHEANGLAEVLSVGGDRFTWGLARRWVALSDCVPDQLVNEYGPTETVVGNAYRRLPNPLPTSEEQPDGALIPLGSAAPGSSLRVLSDELRPLPPRVVGELFLGGAQMADGYLGRPARTADRFVPDPFGPPGSRMYRSGDLGRHGSDGQFRFVGRTDEQVKIRGTRVEPAEVATTLARADLVREAVVVPTKGAGGRVSLTAYVVTDDTVAPSALRDLAVDLLPSALVPSTIVQIDEIPVTTNGKVDRDRLPAPGRDRLPVEESAPPAGLTESLILDVWRTVLGTSSVGVDTNFFEAGGDSLSAVAVVGRLREAGQDVSVAELFRHPTVAEIAALTTGRPDASTVPRVAPFALISTEDRSRVPVGADDAYPLTALQLGMTLEMLSSPDRLRYHNVTTYAVRQAGAEFDESAFRRAADRLADEQEVLRAAFDLDRYSVPMQVIQTDCSFDVTVSDLRDHPEADRPALITQHIEAETLRPFDLANPPLIRLAVLLDDAQWTLAITEFHPILEGWSYHTFLMDLLAGYRALLDTGDLPEPRTLPTRFADFVALERAAVDRASDGDYWSDLLSDTDTLSMPAGWSSPAEGQDKIDVLFADLQAQLEQVALLAGVPLKSVLHAAHLVAMSHLTSSAKFSSGLVCDTRPEVRDADHLYGLFLNVVPFPFSLSSTSWVDLVREVFETEKDMWEHRRYPMNLLQQRRGGSRLIEVIFNYLDFRNVDNTLVDVEQSVDDSPTEFALNVVAFKGGLLSVRFDRGLVDRKSGERLAALYRTVLLDIASRPTADPRRSMLPASERRRVRDGLVGSALELPASTVLDLVVAHPPEAVAVRGEGVATLTYGDLNERSDALARRLRESGAGRQIPIVAIHCDPSPDLVIAMLGVLKAGAAYLLLNLDEPRERRESLLEQADVQIVLSHAAAPYDDDTRTCYRVDDPSADTAADPARRNQLSANPIDRLDLAYVMFTSGSTGRPKGVMVTHEGLVGYLAWADRAYAQGSAGVFPLVGNPAVDLSVTSILLPLVRGAAIHLAPAGSRALGSATRNGASAAVVKATPSHAQLILAEHPDTAFENVETWVLGGENLPSDLVARLQAASPDATIVNEYGPTEAVVGCISHRVEPRAATSSTGAVPIGLPIDNARVYVLDDHLRPVMTGVAGELYLAGPNLARGYLNAPALTADRFVPDPFGPPGARCYRTGDRVSVDADGLVRFHQRVDDQVQIGGTRVEPGEVELALVEHPLVSEAVVTTPGFDDASRRLVAYVCPSSRTQDLDGAELREDLRRTLPAAMVPTSIVVLDSLPMTSAGKVDRATLRDAAPAPRPDDQVYVAPTTTVERRMAHIYQQELNVSELGAEDNLHDLGATSLTGLRVITEIRGMGFEVTPLEIAGQPTIRALARLLEGHRDESVQHARTDAALPDDVRVRQEPAPQGGPVFLTGATGFIGARVLQEILARGDRPVRALVRASTTDQGYARLASALGLVDDEQQAQLRRQVRVVLGDLGRPRFGLPERVWHELSETVSDILHVGATTNAAAGYSVSRPTNVLGTLEVLRLATTGPTKTVHHSSTFSIFPPGATDEPGFGSTSRQEHPPPRGNGYALTKWTAEELVHTAGDRGVPVRIYRMARVSWDSETGVGAADEQFSMLLRACLALRATPRIDLRLSFTPVDLVADGMVDALEQPGDEPVVHLITPHRMRWSTLATWLRETTDEPLQVVELSDWLTAMHAASRTPTGSWLRPLSLIVPTTDNVTLGDEYAPADRQAWEQPYPSSRLGRASFVKHLEWIAHHLAGD